MFTGLIEEIGVIQSAIKGSNSAQLTIKAEKVMKDIKLGDSISTNGVCLTVTHFSSNSFSVDVMPETMRRSNLRNLKLGSKVNLERALKLGERLGGHMVSGHIDGVGCITGIEEDENAVWLTVIAEREILKYIVEKGSIAIDGTSLTVAYVDNEIFKVSIIPLTRDKTTLLTKNIGEEVNLECDLIGKYIERLIMYKQKEIVPRAMGIEFLKENGFA